MTLLQILQLLLGNIGKAPVILTFIQALVAAFNALLAGLGQTPPVAVAHADGSPEAKAIEQLAAALQSHGASEAKKFGDGTILKTLFGALQGLMNLPGIGGLLTQILTGWLGGLLNPTAPTP
jgi:hypothetical protein